MPDADAGHELETEHAERERLERLVADLGQGLATAETEFARIGELELELRDLGVSHRAALDDLKTLEARLAEANALVEHHRSVREQMQTSLSWKVTAPLRAAKSRAQQ